MSAPMVSPVPAFPVNKLLQGVRSSTSFSAERMTRGAGGDLAFLADDGTPVEMGFVLGWLDRDAKIEGVVVLGCGRILYVCIALQFGKLGVLP